MAWRQGVCLGGGGGKMSREPIFFCASPEKVAQRGGGGGGLRHIFFPTSKFFHNGVGVLSWPWPLSWEEKQNCPPCPPPPPPGAAPAWRYIRQYNNNTLLIEKNLWICERAERASLEHFAFSNWKTTISFNILLVLMILCLRNIYFQVSNYICIYNYYTINAVSLYYLLP